MKVRHLLAAGILGLGLIAMPIIPSAQAADDTPAKKPDAPGGGARGQRGPGGFIDRYHEAVNKLTLTDDQKPKIETAFTEAKTKMDAAVKDAGDDRAAMREKTRPVMEDLRKAVDGILTDAQKEELKKSMPQRGAGGPGGRRGNGNGTPAPGDKPAEK